MLRILSTAILVLMLVGSASAQRFSTLPGVQRVPDDLVASLRLLQRQQLDSLERFTEYLERRVEAKAVPPGLHWNAKAIYVEAQVHAETDPEKKQERLAELAKIYETRKQLDAAAPNDTWFGVNRLKLGELTRQEFEAFRRTVAAGKATPPRNPPPP